MHYQQKKLNVKNHLNSICKLDLEICSDKIIYKGNFYMEFKKNTVPYGVTFIHELNINKKNGDFFVTYQIINEKYNADPYRNMLRKRKNNFDKLQMLVYHGFYNGEKGKRFWGKKYDNNIQIFFNAIRENLQKEFKNKYLGNKKYDITDLYEIIVDYHLQKKNIKGHDNVYDAIMDAYPKRKWLKLNDNKFLPAILDEHGIKSKYLIKTLSSSENIVISDITIKSLIYLCNLFGSNYVDYIKKFDWIKIASTYFNRTKKHICKNESEKKVLVKMFKSGDITDISKIYNVLESLYQLFNTREFLEKNGHKNLKLQIKKISDMNFLLEYWLLLKRHLTDGYTSKYKFPVDILKEIEEPIKINDVIFTPKVLSSNDDFCIEGILMKNCMGQQFGLGVFQIFIALSDGKKRINLQYQNGILNMAYAKANTPISEKMFKDAINILTIRMLKHKNVKWEKEKVMLHQNE